MMSASVLRATASDVCPSSSSSTPHLAYERRHPRGLVRYLYDKHYRNHILLCETTLAVSDGVRTRVEVMPDAEAGSLCATMVNELFKATQRGILDLDIINLTLYQSRDKWFRHYVPGSPRSLQQFPAKVNIASFPDGWRESRLSIETGLGGHFFKLLVHPNEPPTSLTAHNIDTRHECSFRVSFTAPPMVCTDQEHLVHWLALPTAPTIHLCHPWGGLGVARTLPASDCSEWAEITGRALERVNFRRDTLTALRFGRIWPDVQRALEIEGARSLHKMGYTCDRIRRLQPYGDEEKSSGSNRVTVRLPDLSSRGSSPSSLALSTSSSRAAGGEPELSS